MATRAERRRDTLLRLSDAAIDAFESDGPNVTIDEIARRAGVARRTVFRYVDGKEELAFIHPVLWFDVFDTALATVESASLTNRLRQASRAIALHIDADPEPPRRAFLVVAQHPQLSRGYTGVFQRWIDRVAREVEAETADATAGGAGFRARVIGAATMGMVDAVTRQWLASPPGTAFVDLYDAGFDVLAPLLEA